MSHGCIRVEKPADLAAWALRHNDGWNLERVMAMMNRTENNVTVNLAKPIPVLIIYGTVAVDDKNTVFFFDDIYGYDKLLDEALKRDTRTRRPEGRRKQLKSVVDYWTRAQPFQ
ncbi:MAG TPA: hypothetical protein VF772_16675 [Terriglobales bacterium]